jgi:Tat protein translocase TatB subunit
MFGIGPSELVIVGLLFLIIFGPSKLPQMARDAGRLMTEARRAMDDFKDELTSAADEDKSDRKKPVKKTSREKASSRAGKSESGKSESGKSESGKSESGKSESRKSEEDASSENGRVSEEEEYDL